MSKPKTDKEKSRQPDKGDGHPGPAGTRDSAQPNDDEPIVEIMPVEEKIGESHDQLRGRERWFQKRSGSRKQ